MKRRWVQFRLRTLFILLTLAAVVTGIVQHVWFVRGRIHFHEGKVVTCEERLTIKLNVNTYFLLQKWAAPTSQPDSDSAESVRIQQAIGEGYLLYAPAIKQEFEFNRANELTDEYVKDIARVEAAQRYHQRQMEAYRRAMWRPWMRVVEDRGQELADESPETAPALTPTVAVPSPAPTPAISEGSVPQLPPSPKVRLPWQSIERPLPRAFDDRDVQVQKAADA
jgi:hypothetical protein